MGFSEYAMIEFAVLAGIERERRRIAGMIEDILPTEEQYHGGVFDGEENRLAELCMGERADDLMYCTLAYGGRKVRCKYLETIPDRNGQLACLYKKAEAMLKVKDSIEVTLEEKGYTMTGIKFKDC